jgi:transposase
MGKFLSKEQEAELLRELRLEKYRRYADRIRVILLLDSGETYKNIAKFLFLDEGTIAHYRKRYVEGGIEELINDEHKGSTSRLSLENQKELELHLMEKIYLCTKDICDYVQKTYHVEYGISGMTALLKRMGFSYKKPKKVPGKANKEAQEKFIQQYLVLKNQGKVYFGDAVHPQHNPVLGYGWMKKGIEVEIFSNSGRNHLNINGAIDIGGRDVLTRFCETVNSSAMCDLLSAIREKNSSVQRIFFILDNARYNHAKEVKLLAQQLKIELVYLPPYSPNLNPIERFWKFFKKKVLYNQYYEKFDEFESSCVNFFKGIAQYGPELSSLITDNFTPMGI